MTIHQRTINDRGIAKLKVFRLIGLGNRDFVARYRPDSESFKRSKLHFTLHVVKG